MMAAPRESSESETEGSPVNPDVHRGTGHVKIPTFAGFLRGATAGSRTQDLGLKRPLLYQLSYRRK